MLEKCNSNKSLYVICIVLKMTRLNGLICTKILEFIQNENKTNY